MKRGTKPHHDPNSVSTKILKHLLECKPITSVEAFTKFGSSRLASIINIFRNMGYLIDTTYRDGSKLAIYSMNPDNDGVNVKLWDERFHNSKSVKVKEKK